MNMGTINNVRNRENSGTADLQSGRVDILYKDMGYDKNGNRKYQYQIVERRKDREDLNYTFLLKGIGRYNKKKGTITSQQSPQEVVTSTNPLFRNGILTVSEELGKAQKRIDRCRRSSGISCNDCFELEQGCNLIEEHRDLMEWNNMISQIHLELKENGAIEVVL